jgi:hypothetical protein
MPVMMMTVKEILLENRARPMRQAENFIFISEPIA